MGILGWLSESLLVSKSPGQVLMLQTLLVSESSPDANINERHRNKYTVFVLTCQARRNHCIYGRVPKHTTVADVVVYFSPEPDLSCWGKGPGVASLGTVCNFGIQIYRVFSLT